MARSPFAVNVGDASGYVSVGELITVFAGAEQTGGAFGLMESVLLEVLSPRLTFTIGRTNRFSSLKETSPCASGTR